MAVASGDGVEKLEDMIVRSAETTSTHIAAAKAAIGAVIFGQEQVVERTLITVLCGGHGMLVGVPGLAKTKLVEALAPLPGPAAAPAPRPRWGRRPPPAAPPTPAASSSRRT